MWWLVAGRAWAGVPVALPPTEQAQDWVGVLALGGLDWATGAATVVVEDRGDTWVVTAGRGGSARSATVPAPRTASQREDVVWLVVSLSSAVSAAPPALPPPVEPARPAPAPRPAPRPTPPPPPTGLTARGPSVPVGVEPEVVLPDPELELPDHLPGMPDPEPVRVFALPPAPARPQRTPLVELPAPPADAGATRPWARVATSVDWHGGAEGAAVVSPRPTGEIAGGIARDQLGLGAGVRFGPRSQLRELGPNRRWSEFDLTVEGWATPSWVRVGLGAGVALRAFEERGQVVSRGAMPFVRGTLAAGVYLGERWSLEPGVSAHLDVGLTELRVDGARMGTLPGRAVSPGLAVRWR